MKRNVKIVIGIIIIAVIIFLVYCINNYIIINSIANKHKNILYKIQNNDIKNYYYKEEKVQADLLWTTETYYKDGIYKCSTYIGNELDNIVYSNINTGEYIYGKASENGMELTETINNLKPITTVYGFSNFINTTKLKLALTSRLITSKNGEYIIPNFVGDTKLYIDKETGFIKKREQPTTTITYSYEKDVVSDNDVSKITKENVE